MRSVAASTILIMKKLLLILFIFVSSCNKSHTPVVNRPEPEKIKAVKTVPSYHKNDKTGFASFYSVASNGGTHTSSGKKLRDSDYVAASCHWPLGTIVRVLNPENGRAVDVRIIDRGPFAVNKKGKAIWPLRPHPNRIIDLTPAAAKCIYNLKQGITKVKIYKIK